MWISGNLETELSIITIITIIIAFFLQKEYESTQSIEINESNAISSWIFTR